MNEEFKDKREIPIEKYEKPHKTQEENHHPKEHPNYPLRLNEMITLSVMKSSHETGMIKKVIHAPTLKIFAVKVTIFKLKNELD